MSIAPPRLPSGARADPDALFAEARRRRRRRRVAGAVLGCLALAGAGRLVWAAGGGDHVRVSHHAARNRPAATAKPTFKLPTAVVAWMDNNGRLHVGNVATRAQHVVATLPSDAGGWFAAAAGHLYWLDFNVRRDVVPIRSYDLTSGSIGYLPRGETVFASVDGRHVYVMRSNTTLTEVDADGSGTRRFLHAPSGWSIANYPFPVAVASGGVIVSAGREMAVWSIRTGRLKRIGEGRPMTAYTPRDGRYSLVAWAPDSCARQASCTVNITNTKTGVMVGALSPLHHGFSEGGEDVVAFSPDGRRLAVFARTAPLNRNTVSELAIVNTRTGKLSLVRSVRLFTLEDGDWALWLPGGQRLLAGGATATYAVDAQNLAARPFSFFAPGTSDTADIDSSAVVLSGGHGQVRSPGT
jgi:hypothetical protein